MTYIVHAHGHCRRLKRLGTLLGLHKMDISLGEMSVRRVAEGGYKGAK